MNTAILFCVHPFHLLISGIYTLDEHSEHNEHFVLMEPVREIFYASIKNSYSTLPLSWVFTVFIVFMLKENDVKANTYANAKGLARGVHPRSLCSPSSFRGTSKGDVFTAMRLR